MNILLSDIVSSHVEQQQVNNLSLILLLLVAVAFTAFAIINSIIITRSRRTEQRTVGTANIMRHALEIGGVNMVKFDMRHLDVSNTYGSHLPQKGMSYDDYLQHIHPDDREQFNSFITHICQQLGNTGELSFRWNAAPDGKRPLWRNLRNSAVAEGRTLPLNVVCTLTDETKVVVEQREESELVDRYQSIFNRSIVGMSFYDKNGMLIAANQNMRELFHFQEESDIFYNSISLFRRPPFRELIDPENPQELHFCTHLTMPERNVNSFLEIMFNPVADSNGNVQYILVTARDVTEERDMYMRARENDQQMRKANEDIKNYEVELQYLLENCDMRVWRADFETHIVTFHRQLSQYDKKMKFEEFADNIIDGRSESAKAKFADPYHYFNQPVTYLLQMRPVFHERDTKEWNLVNSIPIFDKNGRQTGSFGTIRNMTKLIEAQEKLKEETRRTNDSARLKSVFMANMTHEIRTPLNAIVGFSDVLSIIDSPEEKKEMVRVIMNNCDMLLRLINDILEVSSMDANAIRLEPVDVDFSQAFNDICETLAQRVQEPGVQFIRENPYPTFYTHLDPKRIQQVITNFVTNAVKYTHEGHIKVGYLQEERTLKNKLVAGGQETKQGIYIYCEDTGAGIPQEKQASVFERFVKLNDYVQGTGLGLSICKAIATRAGGKIGVTSEGEGHGSTFWMWIPCEVRNEK